MPNTLKKLSSALDALNEGLNETIVAHTDAYVLQDTTYADISNSIFDVYCHSIRAVRILIKHSNLLTEAHRAPAVRAALDDYEFEDLPDLSVSDDLLLYPPIRE